MSETQFGVETILKTEFPVMILMFLMPKYYNTLEQNLAALAFCNITFINGEKVPNVQFLKNVLNIAENTDLSRKVEKDTRVF